MNKKLIPLALLAFSTSLNAQDVLERFGRCPSGYYVSGDYCQRSKSQPILNSQVIRKVGSCPSGYYVSGDYCKPNTNTKKIVLIKTGRCPSGFSVSGDYCTKNQ